MTTEPITLNRIIKTFADDLAPKAIATCESQQGDCDALCLLIQTDLEVQTGDLASYFWDGREDEWTESWVVSSYILQEAADQILHPDLADLDGIGRWFASLIRVGISFHPEETFSAITDRDGRPSLTEAEAADLDRLMGQAAETAKANGTDLASIALIAIRKFQTA